MPKIHLSEQIEIDVPVDQVYQYLADFEKWPEWSPWLICEQDCPLQFEENAYFWDGDVIGSGKMSLEDTTENTSFDYDLQFFKPWKSQAKSSILLEESASGTLLTWKLDSSLPWFLFFLKNMMTRMISMDYQRGLRMLKEQLETGEVDSKLSYTQREDIPGCHYIGIQTTCDMDDIAEQMEKDFNKLIALELKTLTGTPPFTIYSKWQMGKGRCTYTCAMPVSEAATLGELPAGTIAGKIAPCEAFVVTHTGDYQHLGNAWAAAMTRIQSKVIAQDKSIMPFERYLTHPAEKTTPVTQVCIPVK